MKKWYHQYLEEKPNLDKGTMLAILALIVVIAGIFGFVYEYIFYFFNGGMQTFYWRGGNFLPWINIYAYGALGIYFFTFKHRKHPWKVFLIGLLVCGILEFASGYVMYTFFNGWRCWDYNTEIWNFGNIGGFVCLRSVTIFGLSGLLLIYGLLPMCIYFSQKIPKKIFMTIAFVLLAIILIDDLYNLIVVPLFHTKGAIEIYKSLGVPYMS